MSAKVFISHSVKDKDQEAADIIYDYLKSTGLEPYMDKRDLIAGIPYPTQLTQAIKESDIVVIILSMNSDVSGPVQNEIALAQSCNRRIIPVRIEEIKPHGLALFLSAPHWLDVFPGPIQNHLPKLLNAITGRPPPPPPPVTPNTEFRAPKKSFAIIKDYEWHDIDFRDLSAWVKERIAVLNSGKQIVARTFTYRRNRNTGKYQRKLGS